MNYAQLYERISRPWRSFAQGAAALSWIDKALVAVIAASYGTTLVWLAAQQDDRLQRVIAVPAIVLIITTLLRMVFNAPRPYESAGIEPLVPSSTVGQSFPSRHVASAFVIACALGYVNPSWGIAAGIAACLVAYTRVAAGVHFPRDVIAGAVLALLCAAIGFVVL